MISGAGLISRPRTTLQGQPELAELLDSGWQRAGMTT
jgi:hypothetical protein